VIEQPIPIGCPLPSNEVFGRLPRGEGGSRDGMLPAMGEGFSDPGCLTSEDEERETWTAESLRVSIIWKPSIFTRVSGIGAGRKTSAVHVYIGYTIVVRDVNRVQ